MRTLHVADDIVPIGEFKTHASELLRRLHANRRPLVITQNGRPAAVVLTPEEFDALGYREFVKAKIKAGIESAAGGEALSVDKAREHFAARRKARASGRAR
ncbi:type II toxin-antitoxin system Phd/YefM family antitoxin [Sorangium sp. So ce1151]|uniref:type II toxin-antitoxin system Phd/YefM family antitoxin n=1 Tax=Sorangium sp. So ce1151 TaxID=3133332 RepID=UPI003F5ED339